MVEKYIANIYLNVKTNLNIMVYCYIIVISVV